jgi:hypothetical protein
MPQRLKNVQKCVKVRVIDSSMFTRLKKAHHKLGEENDVDLEDEGTGGDVEQNYKRKKEIR